MLPPFIIEQIRRREQDERRRRDEREQPRLEIPADYPARHWRPAHEWRRDDQDEREQNDEPTRGVVILDL